MSIETIIEPSQSSKEALTAIATEAVRVDASDIYLKAGCPPMFRIQGLTKSFTPSRLTAQETRGLAEAMMDADQKELFRRTSELNVALSVDGVGRFRANAYIQRSSVAVVLRRIKTDIPQLEALGLPPLLQELALLKNGLVLVVGATGSGKSTSLAAMIGYRNRMETGHIVTIEDPVEFLHRDAKSIISQREVGTDTVCFNNALKSALRQAPDVILIGEMRDTESVDASLSFAETGHLVLSTLHSTNASQTIERLLQFYPQAQHGQVFASLANNLRAIIAQRLVPRVNGQRVAAIELLVVTPLIRDYLRRHETTGLKKAIAGGKIDGMQTFDQHLYAMYEDKIVSSETALSFADSMSDMRLRMRGLTN